MRPSWPAIALLVASALPALAGDKPAQGMFLVADRGLRDPNFARSVVLLIDYGEHGAAGVIVNRRTEARLADLLPEIEGGEEVAGRVFLGGPVKPEGMLVLVRSDTAPEEARPVFDDVYVSSDRELLERLVQAGATYRVYAGHAGWAPGQLDWELRRGGWFLLPADVEAVFDDEPDEVWRKMMRRVSSPVAWLPPRPPSRTDRQLDRLAEASIYRHATSWRRGAAEAVAPPGPSPLTVSSFSSWSSCWSATRPKSRRTRIRPQRGRRWRREG